MKALVLLALLAGCATSPHIRYTDRELCALNDMVLKGKNFSHSDSASDGVSVEPSGTILVPNRVVNHRSTAHSSGTDLVCRVPETEREEKALDVQICRINAKRTLYAECKKEPESVCPKYSFYGKFNWSMDYTSCFQKCISQDVADCEVSQ